MIISDVEKKEEFIIEEIDASNIEKEALDVIGIYEGTSVVIIGEGYLKGSILVKNSDGIVVQLNPFFVSKIKGSIVRNKKLVK